MGYILSHTLHLNFGTFFKLIEYYILLIFVLDCINLSHHIYIGSKAEEQHGTNNNPMLDHSALMHHDFKKWIDEHPELIAANPNLVAAAAAAMAFSPVSSFPSHVSFGDLLYNSTSN